MISELNQDKLNQIKMEDKAMKKSAEEILREIEKEEKKTEEKSKREEEWERKGEKEEKKEKIEIKKEKEEGKKEENRLKIEREKEEKKDGKDEEKRKKEKYFLIFTALVILVILAIVILSIYLRTQNIPMLKDVTTGHYTLGPDLDPFLYLRHAREIAEGKLQDPDMMRYMPLGIHNYAKTNLMPWAIFYLYKFLNIFFDYPIASVEFAAIIAPVIFFSLTLIVFFFFVLKLFSFITTKKNSVIIALIATVFYAVIPEMLHRTVAGIPEIESLGMLFFWLAFYFFISAWQSDKIKKQIIFGIVAGIFTGLMIFTWGGFRYIFMTFVLASFIAFFFEKQKRKNFFVYLSWFIPSLIFSIAKFGVNVIKSMTDTGLSTAIFLIFFIDFVLFNTKLQKIKQIREKTKEKLKLPESIISLIVVMIAGFVLLLALKPSMISEIVSKIIEGLLYPFGRGRLGLTVAENRAPYFVEIATAFSWLFWIFFFGTIFLFYEATKHFDRKKKLILNSCFLIFMITFIFSRISPQSILNGENFISKFLYFGGLLFFAVVMLSMYIGAYRKKDGKALEDFRNINFSYIFILAFTFWMIVSMRGAIRLFFIISPALIIGACFLPIKIFENIKKTRDDLYKILLWCVLIAIIFILIFTFISYTKTTSLQAKYTIPTGYYQQWQKAMAWVRENTSENAIFAHWWDYGYWVQTIGERPTILDGGNIGPGAFWDHLMGRHVLCGQDEKEALEFLYAHNTSYLLIDSTDIGKYPAYSSIGSDASGKDRLSWISTFVLDEKQTKELRNETHYVYVGGTILDQDAIWQNQIFPAEKAGIAGFVMAVKENKIDSVKAIFVYKNNQVQIPIKYVYINERLIDVSKNETAINAILYIIPTFISTGVNNIGAALYLSEKLMNSLMVKLYLLNQSQYFELVHKEDAPIIEQLREYNINIGDFVYANGIHGPIKIWKVNYPDGFIVENVKLKRYLQPESDLPFTL